MSNVFHSLNEYVNAGLSTESDKNYDSNITSDDTIALLAPAQEELEEDPISNGDQENEPTQLTKETNEEHKENEYNVASGPTSSYSSPSPIMHIEKSKFVFTDSTTSDSLITSSSSPSLSSSASPDDDIILHQALHENEIENSERNDEHQSFETSNTILLTDTLDENADDCVDDVATGNDIGLSSVSSYCPNDDIKMSSNSQSVFTSSLSSLMKPTDYCDDIDQQEVKGVASLQIANPSIITNSTSKPIGFEATMDDVSDTELESYLQDLELEPSLNQVLTNIESLPSSSNDIATDAAIKQIEDEDVSPSVEQSSFDKNCQNADSFSQASTIEFADQRLQSDFEAVNIQSPATEVGSYEDRNIAANNDEEVLPEPKDYERPLQRPNSLDIPNQIESVSPDITPWEQAPPPPIESTVTSESTEQLSTVLSTPVTVFTTQSPTNVPDPQLSISSSDECVDPNTVSSLHHPDEVIQAITPPIIENNISETASSSSTGILTTTNSSSNNQLGKVQPYWIPDSDTNCCMQCNLKFSLIKRRHHCRACGQVLCSSCCSQKSKLEYLGGDVEVRVCTPCFNILSTPTIVSYSLDSNVSNDSGSRNVPNPNNPMEYCSVIPPLQQAAAGGQSTPISVMVPVGVLKREGAPKSNRKEKTVMFSDGIRPGCDLTDLDNWNSKPSTDNAGGSSGTSSRNKSLGIKRIQTPPGKKKKKNLFCKC